MVKSTAAAIGLLGLIIVAAQAAPTDTFNSKTGIRFRLAEVATGLSHPWSLAFLPGGDMLVTERPGRLRLIRGGRLEAQPVSGTPKVAVRGQGGLLDIALHPKFAENRVIYLSYFADGEGGTGIEVMRAKLNDIRLEEGKVIFRAEPKTGGGNNLGSRLLFAPDGTLLITVGDRFSPRDQAQSLSNPLGKILRLKEDGSVPDDNPFKGKAGARPEIFTYGNRNSQGLAWRPGTSEIWEHEHGPRGGDEVNILKPGANYGWPKITYGIDYDGSIISERRRCPAWSSPWSIGCPPSHRAAWHFTMATKFRLGRAIYLSAR